MATNKPSSSKPTKKLPTPITEQAPERDDEFEVADRDVPAASAPRRKAPPQGAYYAASTGPRRPTKKKLPATKREVERARERNELSAETVAYMLEHPNRFPTEQELHGQYAFVLRDLRNMGLLAGALVVTLLILAQIL